MKKLFARFMKDTRGVVMLEYIILGLFAVAVTLAAVGTLGKAYSNGLLAMAYATTGSATQVASVVTKSYTEIGDDAAKAQVYGELMADEGASNGTDATLLKYEIYGGN